MFSFFGLDLGDAGLVFRPRTALVAYVVGILVTLVSAYGPARRASKVPPVAAMRDDVALPESSLRRRLIGGLALSLVGAAVLTAGLLGASGNPVALVGAGVLGVFLGVALLSPYLGRPVVRGIGSVYPRLFGTVGRLARENALRNPRRTAATASALMIGLALVTAMSIFGQSTKSSIDELVTGNLEADYIVSNVFQAPFSPTIAAEISRQDGVASVSQVRYSAATVDEESTFVVGIDPATFFDAVAIDVTAGDAAGLIDGGVLVAGSRAEREGWGVGDPVSVGLPAGSEQHTIAGIFEQSPVLGSDLVLSLDALRQGGVQPADALVYVNAQAGAERGAVRTQIDEVLAGLPTVTLKDQAEFAAEQRASIDPLLYIIYALLGLAITIAVLGIVNTLALSVIERTREVGLLRAVGLSRRQLRTMIRLESVAVALLGAVLGVALGLIFGISLQQALADQGIAVLSVPVRQLLLFVVLAGLVGVLAAVWPARRAARLDVLRAISTQ